MMILDPTQRRRLQLTDLDFNSHHHQDETALPAIRVAEDELQRLSSLANSTMELFPHVAACAGVGG